MALVDQLLQAHQAGEAPRPRRASPRTDQRQTERDPVQLGVRPRTLTAKLSNWQSSVAEKFQPRDFRKDDLRPYYHLNLKEAAGKLGICATTLKRVCRRLGVRKWPRRALAKMSVSQRKMTPVLMGPAGESNQEVPKSGQDPALHTAGSGSGSSHATELSWQVSSPLEAVSPFSASHLSELFPPSQQLDEQLGEQLGSGSSSPQSNESLAAFNPPEWTLPDFSPALGMSDWDLGPPVSFNPHGLDQRVPSPSGFAVQAPAQGNLGPGYHDPQCPQYHAPFFEGATPTGIPTLEQGRWEQPQSPGRFAPTPLHAHDAWEVAPYANDNLPAAADWTLLQHILDTPQPNKQLDLQLGAGDDLPSITSPVSAACSSSSRMMSLVPLSAHAAGLTPSLLPAYFPPPSPAVFDQPHAHPSMLAPPAAATSFSDSFPASLEGPACPGPPTSPGYDFGMSVHHRLHRQEQEVLFGQGRFEPILRGRVLSREECGASLNMCTYLGTHSTWNGTV